MTEQPLVIVAVPCFDHVVAHFAFSLADAYRHTRARMGIINGRGSNIYRVRNKLVQTALGHGADYVLFIDSDMSFPADALQRLIDEAIKNDRDILGCNYTARQVPHNNLVQPKGWGDATMELQGITEVGRLPTGFMIIARRVFEAIGYPYFKGDLVDPDGQMLGEDYELCEKARQHGFKVWVDTDLSVQLVHWGGVGFRMAPGGWEFVETGA